MHGPSILQPNARRVSFTWTPWMRQKGTSSHVPEIPKTLLSADIGICRELGMDPPWTLRINCMIKNVEMQSNKRVIYSRVIYPSHPLKAHVILGLACSIIVCYFMILCNGNVFRTDFVSHFRAKSHLTFQCQFNCNAAPK